MKILVTAVVCIIAVLALALFGAAVSSSVVPTPVMAQSEEEGPFVNLGEVDGVKITKLVDGDHICYIATNIKWNNVAASIDCPR